MRAGDYTLCQYALNRGVYVRDLDVSYICGDQDKEGKGRGKGEQASGEEGAAQRIGTSRRGIPHNRVVARHNGKHIL